MNFEPMPSQYRRSDTLANQGVGAAAFLWTVYRWMALGLSLTGATAWWVAATPALMASLVSNRLVFFGLMAVQMMMVLGLSAAVHRLSAMAAGALFLAYSLVNGLTLSWIFLVYTQAS